MNSTELRSILDVLLVADPGCVERDELAGLVATSRRLRGWIDGFDLRCARQTRWLAEQGRAEPAGSMFGREGGLSNKDAGKLTARENVGSAMGLFESALGDGQVSAGHLDAIAAATTKIDDAIRLEFLDREQHLLAKAATENVDTFARRCRTLVRQLTAAANTGKSDAEELEHQHRQSGVQRWVDNITGMHHTHLELDPLRDAKLWSVIDAHFARLRQTDANTRTPWQQLQIAAIIAAVETGVETGTSDVDGVDVGWRVPEITVLIDLQTLTAGLHPASICETDNGVPLPVSTLRRLCCDAEVLPVVLNGQSVVLDVGRSKRTATTQQRRALRAMYSSCVEPDCTIGFSDCRIHHIRWWCKHKGATDLDNLVPACDAHHHLLHEGGWNLTMTPDRKITWIRPDGVIAHPNTTNRAIKAMVA